MTKADIAGHMGLMLLVAVLWLVLRAYFPIQPVLILILWIGMAAFVSVYWRKNIVRQQQKSPLFWFACALVAASAGLGMFVLDIYFGFMQRPSFTDGNAWPDIENPLAIIFSIAFFPCFFLVAMATAIRSLFLSDEGSN